jgi:hypothetical protein
LQSGSTFTRRSSVDRPLKLIKLDVDFELCITPIDFEYFFYLPIPTARLHYPEMDAILDRRFENVEAALNTLIDSITTYNPSTSAAASLVAADEELNQGLEMRKTISRACSMSPCYLQVF